MNTWTQTDDTLTKTFTFTDFAEALAFVNVVGALAEELQHHPDISIKNYNTVIVTTSTHEEGNTVTEKDHELARQINMIGE